MIINFEDIVRQKKGPHYQLSRYEKILLSQIVRLTLSVKNHTLYRLTIDNDEIQLYDEPEVIEHLKELGYLVEVPGSNKLIVPMNRYDECYNLKYEIN